LADRYVVDTSVLIDFYCKREASAKLLKVCGGRIHIPESVEKEFFGVCSNRPEWSEGLAQFQDDLGKYIKVISMGPAEDHAYDELALKGRVSDRGELDCAAIAITHGYELLMNDNMARSDLMGSGIKVRGSDWVIREANK